MLTVAKTKSIIFGFALITNYRKGRLVNNLERC